MRGPFCSKCTSFYPDEGIYREGKKKRPRGMSDLSVCWQRGVQTEGARWLLEKALSGDQKERDDGICKKNRASNVNEEKTKIKALQKNRKM